MPDDPAVVHEPALESGRARHLQRRPHVFRAVPLQRHDVGDAGPVELLPVAATVEPLVGKDDCGLYPHFAHHVAEGADIAHAARIALVEHRADFLPVHGERVHEVDLGIMAAMGIVAALRIRYPAGIADDRGPVENCVEVFRRDVFPHEINHRHPPRAQLLQAVAQGGR